MTHNRRTGFSLIEALVALTIAAITLTAIFELQIQMVRGQQRATQAIEQAAAQENALALLRNVNPMAQPEGTIALPGGDTIHWISAPKSLPQPNAGFPVGDGAFLVQLFTVTVSIERPGKRAPPPMIVDRLGWRRTQQTDFSLGG